MPLPASVLDAMQQGSAKGGGGSSKAKELDITPEQFNAEMNRLADALSSIEARPTGLETLSPMRRMLYGATAAMGGDPGGRNLQGYMLNQDARRASDRIRAILTSMPRLGAKTNLEIDAQGGIKMRVSHPDPSMATKLQQVLAAGAQARTASPVHLDSKFTITGDGVVALEMAPPPAAGQQILSFDDLFAQAKATVPPVLEQVGDVPGMAQETYPTPMGVFRGSIRQVPYAQRRDIISRTPVPGGAIEESIAGPVDEAGTIIGGYARRAQDFRSNPPGQEITGYAENPFGGVPLPITSDQRVYQGEYLNPAYAGADVEQTTLDAVVAFMVRNPTADSATIVSAVPGIAADDLDAIIANANSSTDPAARALGGRLIELQIYMDSESGK